MKKIAKKISAFSAAILIISSLGIIGASAYNKYNWEETTGGQYKGYVFTWLNGGTAPGTPLTVMGNSTVQAYSQNQRLSKYSIRGNMSVSTYVAGATIGNHKDATNCNGITVTISGISYISNPTITSTNSFVATSANCGHASYTVSEKALS